MFPVTDDTECHQAKGEKYSREAAVDIMKAWL